MVSTTGKPLPILRHIRPRIIVYWNSVKGGIDEYSRELAELKVKIVNVSPVVTYVLRFVLSLHYNAFLVLRLLKARELGIIPRSASNLPGKSRSYHTLRKRVSKLMSFRKFTMAVIDEKLGQKTRSASPGSTIADLPNSRFGKKRKILQRYNSRELTLIRTDGVGHIVRKVKGRKWCPLCTVTENHDGKITRRGHQITSFCEKCDISLCTKRRGSQRFTCWDLFHRVAKLTKRCQ